MPNPTTTTGSLRLHFDGQRFFNPSGANGRPVTDVPRMMLSKRNRWPDHVPVTPQKPPVPATSSEIVTTFIGHATFLMQCAEGNVLFDPFFSSRASPVQFAGPKRVRAPGVRFEDLPDIAYVLLSHNHYDHCDLPALRRLSDRFNPIVITPLGNAELVRSAGISQVQELDWWHESRKTPFKITLTPAQHFSARTPFDRNKALWGGFMLEIADRRIYFAGDSGYGGHFKTIRARLGRPDIAMLPIGAYEPRWFMQDIHMNPTEAVQTHVDLESKQSIAMHFGTIQLTPEGIDAPVIELQKALVAASASGFTAIDVGASVKI